MLYILTWLLSGKTCGPSPIYNLENGVVLNIQRRYFFGDRVYYRCDIGYTWEGEDYVECGSLGRWIGEEPICREATCNNFRNGENGVAVAPPSVRVKFGEQVSM